MGNFGNGDHLPHIPDDYDSHEDWLRYCHESGELPFDPDEGCRGITGAGHYAALVGGVYGHTRRQFQRSFMAWGVSEGITSAQFERNFRALAMMNLAYGVIANTTLDINWATLGIVRDFEIAHKQHEFMDWHRHWLARRSVKNLHLWALERGKSSGVLHSHIMAHIPPDLAIKRFTDLDGITPYRVDAEAALERITGKPLLRTPKSRTVRIRHRSTRDTSHQWTAFLYRMKGLAVDKADAAERYGQHRVSDQGRIVTKRTGVARLLDEKIFEEIRAMNSLPSIALGVPGNRPYDDRYIDWHRQFGHTLILPVTTQNGNRKGRGYIFGPGSGVEPLDIEDAARNGRVSRPPA